MPLTWAEQLEKKYSKSFREAYQEGRQEARQEERQAAVENLRKLVLRLIEQRFGPVPEATRRKIEEIDSSRRLTSIAEKILVVSSLNKLRLE